MLGKFTHSQSAHHLSDDYVWNSLKKCPLLSNQREELPTFTQDANTQTVVSTDASLGLPLLADHPTKQKLAQAEILGQSERVPPSVPLPSFATAISPPQSSRENQLKL